MKRFLRIGKWVIFLLGSIIALFPLILGIMTWQAEKKLGRELKALAASGAPIKLTQLAKPPIPDSENAALVYEEAFAATDLSRADHNLFAKLGRGEISFRDPGVAAKTKAIIARNAKALSFIRQAASMPKIDFKEDWGKGAALLFPQYDKLRSCSRLLAYDSRLARSEGRGDDALQDCQVNFRVSQAADEPVLIGQLVRYAIIAISYRELDLLLQEAIPSSRACRAAAWELSQINLTPGLIKTMEGERAMGLWCFDDILRSADPAKALAELPEGSSNSSDAPVSQPRQSPMIRWWLAEDESFYLQLMAEQVRRAASPYREIASLPDLSEKAEKVPHWWNPHLVTLIVLPVQVEQTNSGRDVAQAKLNLAQVALWLKAYRSEQAIYPDSLEELASAEKVSLPLDPFSGKPLVYHREGEGFMLYSWSLNLKDDGGKPPKKRYNYEVGDIVLRCLR